jgi:hypothetical protein
MMDIRAMERYMEAAKAGGLTEDEAVERFEIWLAVRSWIPLEDRRRSTCWNRGY